MQRPSRARTIASAVLTAAIIACAVVVWSLVTGVILDLTAGSLDSTSNALIGVVLALTGAGVVGLVAASPMVAEGLARRTALVFVPAVSVLLSAGMALAWALITAAGPSFAHGQEMGWLTGAFGAVVLLGPLATAVAVGHIPAVHPWRAVLAAICGTVVLTATTPLTGWMPVGGAGLPPGGIPVPALAVDLVLSLAAVSVVLVAGSLSGAPADEPVAAQPTPAWATPLLAGVMVLALVGVTLASTLRVHDPASELALGPGALSAEAVDDGLSGFVLAVDDFRAGLGGSLRGERPLECGAGRAEIDCLRELLRACEKRWPANLAPEVDAIIGRLLQQLHITVESYEDVRPGSFEDRAARIEAFESEITRILDELDQARRDPKSKPMCSPESLREDLSAHLGEGIVVVSRDSDVACRDGWAVITDDPSCENPCENGWTIVRRIQGRWQIVTGLPVGEGSGHCKESMAAEGAPALAVEQVPPCPARTDGPDSGGPGYDVTERPDHTVELNFSSDVLFEFGSDELTPAARQSLDGIAARLTTAAGTVQVEGHTDSISSAEFNQQLSERRAQAARDYLAAAGVTAEMQAVGYGLTRPVAPNTNPDGSDNPQGRARNRRVTIVYQPGP